jgi:hypothetical protein
MEPTSDTDPLNPPPTPITEYVLIDELDQHLFQSTTPPLPAMFSKSGGTPPKSSINRRTSLG